MGKSIFPLYVCGLPFLQYWARLPSMVLGPSILSKGVETNPTTTHFSSACAQTMHFLPDFDHIPMAGRATTSRAVHDPPGPDKPPGTRSSSPETARSKLGFGRTRVAGTWTREHRFELQVGF